jgi:Tlde1 domain
MTYGVDTHVSSKPYDQKRPTEKAVPQNVLGGIAFAFVGLVSAWTLYANLAGTHPDLVLSAPTVTVLAARPTAPAGPVADAPSVAARELTLLTAPLFDVALLDSRYSSGLPPATFSTGATVGSPPRAGAQTVRRVAQLPLPTPRPADLGLSNPGSSQIRNPLLDPMAQRNKGLSAAAANNLFEKLFGRPEAGPALAYAPADGGVSSSGQSIAPGRLPPNDGLTAIYDITARTVHMPDGAKLEAHSGLGRKMDDPRYVHVKMHGATPPHVYDLVPREAPFHGVHALRMVPVGGAGAVFGRTGLLTHSYLLGPNGDSNGCVSFKDYDAFLRAYQKGRVKRLVVVASLN